MPIICKVCILEYGLKHLGKRHIMFKDETEFLTHLEKYHDISVTREEETDEVADERLKNTSKTAGTDNCLCPTCRYGDLWQIILQAFMLTNMGFWVDKPPADKRLGFWLKLR